MENACKQVNKGLCGVCKCQKSWKGICNCCYIIWYEFLHLLIPGLTERKYLDSSAILRKSASYIRFSWKIDDLNPSINQASLHASRHLHVYCNHSKYNSHIVWRSMLYSIHINWQSLHCAYSDICTIPHSIIPPQEVFFLSFLHSLLCGKTSPMLTRNKVSIAESRYPPPICQPTLAFVRPFNICYTPPTGICESRRNSTGVLFLQPLQSPDRTIEHHADCFIHQ